MTYQRNPDGLLHPVSAFSFDLSCVSCGAGLEWRGQEAGTATERTAVLVCSDRQCRREQYVSLVIRPLQKGA